MKVTIIGGGSFRTLPIVRGALSKPEILSGGEIALYDINTFRAETVARLIKRTPEYAQTGCKVSWGMPIEDALEGADVVKVGFPCCSPLTVWRGAQVSKKYGFMHSDQMSPTGAFDSLYGGPILLDYARKMEQYCPDAWFVIFANPVAVYSALINNYTKIRALGICGGYVNHMWDLSRLLGKDELRTDLDVDSAGVNHLSFILRGKVGNKDLFSTLEQSIGKGWKPPKILPRWGSLEKSIIFALYKQIDLYRKFGTMIFSTEFDGMAHLFYEEMVGPMLERVDSRSLHEVKAGIKRGQQGRQAADEKFRSYLDMDLDAAFWDEQTKHGTHFGCDDAGIEQKILQALAGLGPQKIAASFPNRGAVKGFSDDTVLEYTQYLDRGGLTPAANLYVPTPFQGIISAIATHQTLLADALGTEDPRVLYQALYTYPIKQNTQDARDLYTELLQIHKDEMPAVFQQTKKYFK